MDLKKLLYLLEERLVQHDENRKEVQAELEMIRTRIVGEADSLENRINKKIHAEYDPVEERIINLIENLNVKLSNRREGGDFDFLMDWAQQELMVKQRYSIDFIESSKCFSETYDLGVMPIKSEKDIEFNDTGRNAAANLESAIAMLQDHLNSIQDSMKAAQAELAEICNERRIKAEEIKKRINEKLDPLFTHEDKRMQSVVKVVRENINSHDGTDELLLRGKTTLITVQKYSITNYSVDKYPFDNYDLVVTRQVSLRDIDFDREKPTNVVPSQTDRGDISILFNFLNNSEIEVLKQFDLSCRAEVNLWEKGHDNDKGSIKTLTKTFTLNENTLKSTSEKGLCAICISDAFVPSTSYCMRMKIKCLDVSTEFSDTVEFTTTQFRGCCVWKECPEYVDSNKKYTIDPENLGIATHIGMYRSIVIGNASLPLNKVVSWNIRILKMKYLGSGSGYIGVAPSDINQNADIYSTTGWYLDCFRLKLCSRRLEEFGCSMTEEYKIKKERGKEDFICKGDVINVVMDTANGELSFGLNGVNYGVAYKGIPLDKPLVPCIILWFSGDSAELEFLN